MLSVLTVQQVGSSKTIEMYHSSPEGEDLCYLIGVFISRHQTWTTVVPLQDSDVILLRDARGTYWIAESQVYEIVCFSIQD